MRCPALHDLPPPPPGKTGWPWTEESEQLPDKMPDGSSWPKVSIVTPSYNQGQFIEETIRSVLLQGYPNLEYLIVDGGSTDRSVEIIRKYDRWLAFCVSEPDRGQSHAINKGWSRATGEIFAWLCSDDVYKPGAIGSGATALHRYPMAAVVYSDCQNIDAHGRPLVLRRPGEFDFARLLWHLSSFIPQPTTFIRRPVLEEVGFVDETLIYSMDYELWLRIGMRYPFRYCPGIWACTRMHPGAKTVARHRESWEHKLQLLQKTLASPNLPRSFREQVPALYSTYYWTLARACLREHEVSHALAYFTRAVLLWPSILLKQRSWRGLMRTVRKLMRHGAQPIYMPAGRRRKPNEVR